MSDAPVEELKVAAADVVAEGETQAESAIARAESAVVDDFEMVKQRVETWWHGHIHDSPASRLTEVYNYLLTAKQHLLDSLKQHFNH